MGDGETVVLAGGLVTLSLDGDQWCALYGLQGGVAGLGGTKVDALRVALRGLE